MEAPLQLIIIFVVLGIAAFFAVLFILSFHPVISPKEYEKIKALFKEYEIELVAASDVRIIGRIRTTNYFIKIEYIKKRNFAYEFLLSIEDPCIDFFIEHDIYIPLYFKFNSIKEFCEMFKSIGVKEYFEMQFRQKIKEAKINSIKSTANSFEV